MIEIFDSYSVQSSYNAQQLFNLLAEKYNNFYNIVYDSNNPSNVTELWINEAVHLEIRDSSNYNVVHSNGYTLSYMSTPSGHFYLVITEDSLFVHTIETSQNTSSPKWIVITPIIDEDGNKELGCLADGSASNSVFYLFTKNQTIVENKYNRSDNGIWKSSYYTVLTPIYSLTNSEYTDHCYQVLLSKISDDGKVLLNNKKYYIHDTIALEYT